MGNGWSLTADYIYTNYGKVSASGIGNAAAIIGDTGADDSDNYVAGPIPNGAPEDAPYTTTGGLVGNASARLATQALMVGLKYTFAAI